MEKKILGIFLLLTCSLTNATDYKVKSLNGNQVILNEIWTGWNNFPDSDQQYTIK